MGVTIQSIKYLTDVAGFFAQISLIGAYCVSTVNNCRKSASFPLDWCKGIPMHTCHYYKYILVSIKFVFYTLLFQVVADYELVEHQENVVFPNVLIQM